MNARPQAAGSPQAAGLAVAVESPRPRSPAFGARAERWQQRFYWPIKVAGCLAIGAVAIHLIDFHHVLHTLSLVCAWSSWSIFAAEVAVMLVVSKPPRAWTRGHHFDLAVLLVAFPLWPHLFNDLFLSELLPSFTLFDATLLAKLVKARRALRRHDPGAASAVESSPAERRTP